MLLEPVPLHVVAAKASPWVQKGRAVGAEGGRGRCRELEEAASFQTSPTSWNPRVPAQEVLLIWTPPELGL